MLSVIRGTVIQSATKYIENGAVVVNDDTILAVGTWDQIRKDYSTNEVHGSERHIVLPGFVNTHSHAVQTFFRGAADDLELLPWLENVILPGEATLTENELEASCRVGYAEMLLSGITTTNDMLTANHSASGMKAAEDSGIRGRVGKMLMDREVPQGLMGETEEVLNEAITLAEKYPRGGRIQFSFTPRFIPTCTDRLMRESSRLAKEHQLMMHTHASENRGECELVRNLTGRDNLLALKEMNALGDHVVLAHAVWTTEEERSLLQETRTNISHNPTSNSKLASGIAPIPEFMQLGLNIGLATDGSPATGGHDFFLEMKLASFLQKAHKKNPKVMQAREVFHLATFGGAQSLNYTDIGKLEEGFRADILTLDAALPNAYPRYDPYSFLVYTAQTRDIDSVMVNGQTLVDKGQLVANHQHYYDIAKTYATQRPFETRTQ